MIVLNINEKQWYIYKDGFAEEVINDMFKEYFDELYQGNAVIWRINEMRKKISMKIPKQAIFVEKDSILYAVNSSLEFKLVPEEFFEMNEVSHPILIECFKKCYSEFKMLMRNYRDWNEEKNRDLRKTDSIANVCVKGLTSYVPCIESLSSTLDIAESKFNEILNISLKQKMCDQVCPKISKVYESALLQSNPIMLITKVDDRTKKIYAITDNLEVEEVTYFLIERELEEIIHEVVPEDTDFLVNRIYNFMMLPLSKVKPCIRINKVQDVGLNATIFLEEKEIPVVCDYNLDYFYFFAKITRNTQYFPTSKRIRYNGNYIETRNINPERGVKVFQSLNQTMFEDISCYIEDVDESYEIWCEDKHKYDISQNVLYRLEKGVVEQVVSSRFFKKSSHEHEIVKEEDANAREQGVYAFWGITVEA